MGTDLRKSMVMGLGLLLLASGAPSNLIAKKAPTPLAKVDGKVITEEDLSLLLPQGISTSAEQKKVLLDNLIAFYVVANQSEKHKFSPAERAQIELITKTALGRLYIADLVKSRMTEKRVEQALDKIPDQDQLILRYISVSEKSKAKSIIKALKAGENFGKLASQHTEDEKMKKNEGQVGAPVLLSSLPKAFSSVLEKLPTGSFTETPIEGPRGIFFIFLIEDRRKAPREALMPLARTKVKLEITETEIKKLTEKAKVMLYKDGKYVTYKAPVAKATLPNSPAALPASTKG